MSNFDIEKFPESETAKQMLKRVSPVYDNAYVGKWLFEVMGRELDEMKKYAKELASQMFTHTVTWGIEYQEDKYSVGHPLELSLEERRARLKRKKSDHNPLNPRRLELNIADNFNLKTDVDETRGNGILLITLLASRFNKLKELKDYVRTVKPSHLSVIYAAYVGELMKWNYAKPAEKVEITPEKRWTETRKLICFDAGLNTSGIVETVSTSSTTKRNYQSYVFHGARLNLVKLNAGGDYHFSERDVGKDVTDKWDAFNGKMLNGKSAPFIGDSRKETLSRTYHVANWQEVIGYYDASMNDSQKSLKKWQTSETKTTTTKRFKSPGFAMNACGVRHVTRKDIGEDIEVTDILFSDGLNSGKREVLERTSEKSHTSYNTEFPGSKLNSKHGIMLNTVQTVKRSVTATVKESSIRIIFRGSVMNGKPITNSVKHSTITRLVHVEKWRDVVYVTGGSLLNNGKHTVKHISIAHTEPATYGKLFKYGTFLNSKAVMGYLRL